MYTAVNLVAYRIEEEAVRQTSPREPIMLFRKLNQIISILHLGTEELPNLLIPVLARRNTKLGRNEPGHSGSNNGIDENLLASSGHSSCC